LLRDKNENIQANKQHSVYPHKGCGIKKGSGNLKVEELGKISHLFQELLIALNSPLARSTLLMLRVMFFLVIMLMVFLMMLLRHGES
jgi:hypothetical protein